MSAIAKAVRQVRLYRYASLAVAYAALWLISSLAIVLLYAVAGHFYPFPPAVHRVVAGGLLLWSLYVGLRFALRAAFPAEDEQLIRFIQSRLPDGGDEMLSAWQLARKTPAGVSGEMIDELVRKVERRMAGTPVRDIVPLRRRAVHYLGLVSVMLLVSSSLSFLPPHVARPAFRRLLPFSFPSGWSRYFSVLPGNLRNPWGESVAFAIEAKQPMPGAPELWLKSEGTSWRRLPLSRGKEGSFTHSLPGLTANVNYYVVWNEWTTPVFSLVPVISPELGSFRLEYEFPSYTGLRVREVADDPNIAAPAGSRVTIHARSNKALAKASIAMEGSGEVPARVSGDRFEARLRIENEGRYRFILEATDGTSNRDGADYRIAVVADNHPEIEILSPRGDLVVAGDAELPLIIRARDDFGLTDVKLHFARGGDAPRSVAVSTSPFPGQETFEFLWDIGRGDARPGEKIRYYLEARDNDTVRGPKAAATPAQTLEISDDEREHDAIEADLKNVRGELLNILADQTAAHARLKALTTSFSSAAHHEALRSQGAVASAMDRPIGLLDGLLRRMELDPRTDFATYGEYRALQSQLRHLKDVPMATASAAIETKEFDEAARRQQEIIASLENLSLLSEDIWHYQRMRDVIDAGARLGKAGDELLAQLQSGAPPEDLRKTLDSIDELLAEVSRQLSTLPQELPEDFINTPAVQQIDVRATAAAADELRQAIEAGDWGRARELAASLKESLARMVKTLEEAGSDVGFSSGASERLRSGIAAQQAEVEGIIREQEEIVRRTEGVDRARRSNVFRAQEQLLGELARRQQEVTRKAEAALPLLAGSFPSYGYLLPPSIDMMKKVLGEFRSARVYHSQKYLEDIIVRWEEGGRAVASDARAAEAARVRCGKEISDIVQEEREIARILREPPQGQFLGQEEKKRLEALQKEQDAVSERTRSVRRSIEELSRKSALAGPGLSGGLAAAGEKMQRAGRELSEHRPAEALESQRQALDALRNTEQGMAAAAAAMDNEGSPSGRGKGTPFRLRSGGGSEGMHSAPVRLPRIQDYRAPREFRQEILEALKERYPEHYDKMIKDYYRRLTK